ncbi:glycosyltransferase family 2 protein [Polaribacter sp. MED152]|uniref:glycosyltransferase family 2 protein n=1 Tax=Polaribacter sp. MED152 TaxID=313598 RepID=UPI000068C74E|nr:glycosyltransferase family 2 protein [Polaribacter sp. MED152]EAQ42172.1 glycosyl transferase family 2 [Polaribacter sp. MED152]
MKISIITVSYNSESTIETTFKSVAIQKYKNVEYILIDGGSQDNTLSIAKKYNHIITKIVSEKDNGLYDAMNKGIKLATGDVIGIINSDDLFCDQNALEKVIDVFNKNQNLDSVYADLFYVSQFNINKIVRRWVTGNQKPFKNGWHPAHPTFYIKKSVYDKFGLFDLSFKLAADFEIMLRFLDKHKISAIYLQEPLVKMRLGGETNKSFKNIYNQNVECIRAFKKNDLKVNKFLYPFFRLIPKFFQFKG